MSKFLVYNFRPALERHSLSLYGPAAFAQFGVWNVRKLWAGPVRFHACVTRTDGRLTRAGLDLCQFPLGPTTMSGRTRAQTHKNPETYTHRERAKERETIDSRERDKRHLSPGININANRPVHVAMLFHVVLPLPLFFFIFFFRFCCLRLGDSIVPPLLLFPSSSFGGGIFISCLLALHFP